MLCECVHLLLFFKLVIISSRNVCINVNTVYKGPMDVWLMMAVQIVLVGRMKMC